MKYHPLLLLLLISGCTATFHIKRACVKMPSLCDTIPGKPDTVFIPADSVYMPGDSILVPGKDTTIYQKGKAGALLKMEWRKGQLAGVACICAPVPAIVVPRIDIRYIKIKPKWYNYIGAAGVGALIVIIAMVILVMKIRL